MIFKTKQNTQDFPHTITITLAAKTRELVKTTRFLEIHIDNTLSWSVQRENVCYGIKFELKFNQENR
mgnify:CR=1 FL=1